MFKIRALTATEKKGSLIYRLDPRTKLIVLFSIGMIVIGLDRPWHLLILFIFTVMGHILAGFDLSKYKVTLLIILIGLWGVVMSQGIFYREWPRTVILTIIPRDLPIVGQLTGGVYLYRQGLLYGLAQGLRFATMIASGLLIAWTTEPRDLLLGLIRLRLPYGIAFMFITSIRFLPILISELTTVIEVQRLRGAGPIKLGKGTIRSVIDILTPVLANSVKRAATLGASCESRAFNPNRPRTYLRELHYRWWDVLISGLSIAAAIAIVITKMTFLLYRIDILYLSQLRWLYAIAREL